MKRNIKVWILSMVMIIGIGTNVQASDVQIHMLESGRELESSIRAEIIKWRYKMVDGVLYRRLYNYTRKQWIGKWEKV